MPSPSPPRGSPTPAPLRGSTSQGSPFRGSTAVAAGLTTWGRLRGSRWRRLLPDVYAARELPLDHRTWCLAVALILPPGTAIGGVSAACLWGADVSRTDARVSVVTPRTRRINPHPRTIEHYTTLAPGDLTTITVADGIALPVTTPARTAFDLGRRLRRADALVATDALLRTGVLNLADVTTLLTSRPRWPRTAQLREVLRLADARAESPMESRMRLLLHDAGLPPPHPQHEIRDEHGHLLGRVDLAWKSARVAAEYEGDHHRERDQYQRDVARLNALHRAGWTILRFTADDILRSPRRTAATVAAELSRRS